MSGAESLLAKEYDEINQYVRGTCQLTMSWYTFFVTGNLIASGWLVSGELKGNPTSLPYLVSVSLLFIGVNVLSLAGFGKLIPYLEEKDVRLLEIVEQLKKMSGEVAGVASPLPKALYVQLLKLYRWSLRFFCVFWVALLALNATRERTMSIDWAKTANVAQVGEALVVAVSVFFIWFQLRQQTKLAKVANSQALVELYSPFHWQVLQDREVAKLVTEGHEGYATFSEVDKYRYRVTLAWRLTFQENIYYQHKNGLIDTNIYQAWEDDFKFFVEKRRLKLRWPELKEFYHQEFRGYVSKQIEEVDRKLAQHVPRPTTT